MVGAKSASAGKDLGKTAFALRVVYPWYDESKKLLGYLETGQEIEEFLGVAAAQSGNELALVLRKDALDEDEWAVMRENRGLENTWDEHDEYVVADSTRAHVDTAVIDDISLMDLPDGGDAIRTDVIEGTRYVVGAFPVTNTIGDRVGFVVVEHDITSLVDQLNRTRFQMTVILLIIGAILILVVIFMLNTLVFNRLASMTEHMEAASTRLAGGDFDIKVPKVKANDEIGSFERFFAQFLKAVSQTLQQLTKE
jgi:methyl-accepting chemotaxis protein